MVPAPSTEGGGMGQPAGNANSLREEAGGVGIGQPTAGYNNDYHHHHIRVEALPIFMLQFTVMLSLDLNYYYFAMLQLKWMIGQ